MNFLRKVGRGIRGVIWDSWDYYEKCSDCNKPAITEENLKRLKKLILGGAGTGCVAGAVALPLAGFGAGGVAAGSFAASWQSAIGSVAAGSLFATLQSLGATGVGVLLFGSVGTALGLLGSIATRLGWCTCAADKNKCPSCEKPMVCEPNLKAARNILLLDSSIKLENSFDLLHTLEPSDKGIIFFGDNDLALSKLTSLARLLGLCTCLQD